MKHPLVITANCKLISRRSLNYQAIARKALHIEQLPPGALPYYCKEPEEIPVRRFKHDHLVIDNRGKLTGKGQFLFARKIIIPTFEIFSNPTVSIADIRTRRFSLIDRCAPKPAPVYPRKFKHDIFQITNNGKLIDKADRKRRRFAVIDRAVQKARQ